MLPPGDHQRACRVFCRILKRLEERDRRNGQDTHISIGAREADNHSINISRAAIADRNLRPGVPTGLNTRADEKRLC